MAAPAWSQPQWTKQLPPGVSLESELKLLDSLANQAANEKCRIVPARELEFETREFADLVIERKSDRSRLMFGLPQKGPTDRPRIDVLTRPRTGHALLVERDGQWRLALGSSFLHPKTVAQLGLKGILTALLDERT